MNKSLTTKGLYYSTFERGMIFITEENDERLSGEEGYNDETHNVELPPENFSKH